MAKVGSWGWEGKQKIEKSRDEAHDEEIREAEEYSPATGLFSDETDDIYEDPYFDLHTFDGPF